MIKVDTFEQYLRILLEEQKNLVTARQQQQAPDRNLEATERLPGSLMMRYTEASPSTFVDLRSSLPN
jgi:hypothetical protein